MMNEVSEKYESKIKSYIYIYIEILIKSKKESEVIIKMTANNHRRKLSI